MVWGLALLFVYLVVAKLCDMHLLYHVRLFFEFLVPVPLIQVEMSEAQARDDEQQPNNNKKPTLRDPIKPGFIQCYDPSTGEYLGQVRAMTAQDVHEAYTKAATLFGS